MRYTKRRILYFTLIVGEGSPGGRSEKNITACDVPVICPWVKLYSPLRPVARSVAFIDGLHVPLLQTNHYSSELTEVHVHGVSPSLDRDKSTLFKNS